MNQLSQFYLMGNYILNPKEKLNSKYLHMEMVVFSQYQLKKVKSFKYG